MSLINLSDTLNSAPISKGNFNACTSSEGAATLINPEVEALINEVREGVNVHFVSRGAWSMHELLEGLLRRFGRSVVMMSTYAVSETAARTFSRLKDEGLIADLYCVIDNRVDVRSAGSLQLLRSTATRMALCACHAKVTVLDFWGIGQLTIVGSANYTENNRYEVGFITMDRTVADCHNKWILDAIADGAD